MNTLLIESLLSTNCFPHAAIFRRKDCTMKVRTSNWPLSNSDANRVIELFEDATMTREQGFTLGSVPYKAVRVDERSIYGKRDEEAMALLEQQHFGSNATHTLGTTTGGMTGHAPPSTLPTLPSLPDQINKTIVEVNRPTSATTNSRSYNGIIICRTQQYFIVGIYDAHPGMAVEAMERLSDYFRSKGR